MNELNMNESTNKESTNNESTNKSKNEEKSFNKKIRAFINEKCQFLIHLLFITICIIIYFLIGCGTLYGSKLAFSNILPTDVTQFPYTDIRTGLKPNIESDIFKVLSDPVIASKMQFPFDEYNTSNFLINWTRKMKNTLDVGDTNYYYYLFMNYFTNLYVVMINFNYKMLNFNLNALNLLPNDLSKIIIGPIILIIMQVITSIINPFYFIFSWFYNLGTFLDFEKSEKVLEKSLDFKGILSIFNPIINPLLNLSNMYISFVLLITMIILFFIMSPLTFTAIGVMLFIVNTSWFFYKSIINNNEKATMFETMMTLFDFYKLWIIGAIIISMLGLSIPSLIKSN